MAIDYFTKWVEAEPFARITDSESRKFVWKSIITRFGIPKCFVSDNGTQFDSGPFKKSYSDFGIKNHFSSPAYPQGNGQAESSNKIILNGIKKKIRRSQGKMGGGAAHHIMDIQNDASKFNRRDPFLQS